MKLGVMESVFSNVSTNWGNAFAVHGSAKLELFDDTEMFYNQQRRHSTLDHNGPAAAPTPGIVIGVRRTTEGRPNSAVNLSAETEHAHLGFFALTVDRDETVVRETIRPRAADDTWLDQFVLRRQGATASMALSTEGRDSGPEILASSDSRNGIRRLCRGSLLGRACEQWSGRCRTDCKITTAATA